MLGISDVADELGKFLAVRSCGHLEVTVAECVGAYVRRHATGPIANYAAGAYKSWTSPKFENLKATLTSFSPQLAVHLRNHLDMGERDYISDLGSLVNARGKVAHGQNEQVTIRKALDYCSSALYVASWYERAFAPGGIADAIQLGVDEAGSNRDAEGLTAKERERTLPNAAR